MSLTKREMFLPLEVFLSVHLEWESPTPGSHPSCDINIKWNFWLLGQGFL